MAGASSWAKSTCWFDINNLPELAFDHQSILDFGIETLKRRVRYSPVGFELLPQKFTLSELQDLPQLPNSCSLSVTRF